jgi:hypothetical protein
MMEGLLMAEQEQFWRYDVDTGLVVQLPSEEIAIYFAESSDLIIFTAALYDVQEYPYEAGATTILGPGVVFDRGFEILFNGRAFVDYPWTEGSKIILGPQVSREENVVTVNGKSFYRTCDAPVVGNWKISKCIMPINHRSNQHEDKDGNVSYA